MDKKEYSKEEGDALCTGMCERCGLCAQEEERVSYGKGCHRACGLHCFGRHYLLRWVLGILILAFVFSMGVKLGEFKERTWNGGYGYRQAEYTYRGMPGYGMMQWGLGGDENWYTRSELMRRPVEAPSTTPIQ